MSLIESSLPMPDAISRSRKTTATFIMAVWLLAAGGGTIALIARESQQAERTSTPGTWPGNTSLHRAPGRSTLLMFVHPNCPCTRASIAQLLQVVDRMPPAERPETIFVSRPAAVKDWRSEWLTSMAAAVPGSTIVRDENAVEASRFGAAASGHVLLYGPDGSLRFDGGVTMGRGHQGDNDASDALAARLADARRAPAQTAVFGCSIESGPRGSAR